MSVTSSAWNRAKAKEPEIQFSSPKRAAGPFPTAASQDLH